MNYNVLRKDPTKKVVIEKSVRNLVTEHPKNREPPRALVHHYSRLGVETRNTRLETTRGSQ